jgi:hypothetical protein
MGFDRMVPVMLDWDTKTEYHSVLKFKIFVHHDLGNALGSFGIIGKWCGGRKENCWMDCQVFRFEVVIGLRIAYAGGRKWWEGVAGFVREARNTSLPLKPIGLGAESRSRIGSMGYAK